MLASREGVLRPSLYVLVSGHDVEAGGEDDADEWRRVDE
jgi:hypothetical protein